MATKSTNAELMNRIDKQNEVISHALNRISNLTDEENEVLNPDGFGYDRVGRKDKE